MCFKGDRRRYGAPGYSGSNKFNQIYEDYIETLLEQVDTLTEASQTVHENVSELSA